MSSESHKSIPEAREVQWLSCLLFFTYSVDGGTQVPDGDMGVVMQNGVNLRFTDFAPESTVQAVSIALICDACIVFERRSSIVLLL